MNIGIRLHDTAGNTLAERLDNAKAQGFACVHLAMQKAVPGFAMGEAPRLLTEALAAEVREALESRGMTCAVLGCYLNLATPDEEAYRRTLEIYFAHLRFARWMGALTVGTETGAPNTGYKTEPATVKAESRDDGKTVMLITITEGKNRQIRRMLDTIGAKVIILKRISYGNLRLGNIGVGKYRVLTEDEINYLKSL